MVVEQLHNLHIEMFSHAIASIRERCTLMCFNQFIRSHLSICVFASLPLSLSLSYFFPFVLSLCIDVHRLTVCERAYTCVVIFVIVIFSDCLAYEQKHTDIDIFPLLH